MVATTCDVIVDYTTGNMGRFMPPNAAGFGTTPAAPSTGASVPGSNSRRRPNANQVPTRARKVTITEITEDNDDWSLISNDGSEDGFDVEGPTKTTEEAFKMFDDLVQDWKSKLELIVGDGLKKLRKNGREKKLMMKYLPGDNAKKVNARIAESKTAIYKDWRIEFNKIMGQSQKKIEKLAHEKMVEAEQLIADNLLPRSSSPDEKVINQSKKTLVNVEFDNNDDDGNNNNNNYDGGYQNLMDLIKDLEKVCNVFSPLDNCNSRSSSVQSPIPIYQPNLNNSSKLNNSDPRIDRAIWLREYLEPLQNEVFHHEGIRSILEEFKVKHFNNESDVNNRNNNNSNSKLSNYCYPALKVKTDRRNTHVNAAQKKMLERKQKREAKEAAATTTRDAAINAKESGKYKLVQVQKDGKERFLICKKNERQTQEKNASEEIFAEWNKNLEAPAAQPKRKRQRTRKLTHRYLRKAVVKSAKEANCKGSYAEMLKKNLKNSQLPQPNVEDILEAWRDSLRGLELQAQSQKVAARTLARQEQRQEAEDIFKAWRHNLNVERSSAKKPKPAAESVEQILFTAKSLFQPELCGAQPTVASIQKQQQKTPTAFGKQGKLKPVAKHLKLGGGDKGQESEKTTKNAACQETRSYEAEEIFAQWRSNLSDGFFLRQPAQQASQVKESSKKNKKSQSQGNQSSKQSAEKVLQISQHEATVSASQKSDEKQQQQQQQEDVLDDFVICKPKRRNSRKNKGGGGEAEKQSGFDQKFFSEMGAMEDFAEDPEVYQPKKGGRKGGKKRSGRNNSNI